MYLFQSNMDCKPIEQMSIAVEFGVGSFLQVRLQENGVATTYFPFVRNCVFVTPTH